MGQNCKPCLKNTYGERCRHSCSCSGFEMYALQLKSTNFLKKLVWKQNNDAYSCSVGISTKRYSELYKLEL